MSFTLLSTDDVIKADSGMCKYSIAQCQSGHLRMRIMSSVGKCFLVAFYAEHNRLKPIASVDTGYAAFRHYSAVHC